MGRAGGRAGGEELRNARYDRQYAGQNQPMRRVAWPYAPAVERPPQGLSERERRLLERACIRAGVPFTEWECARLLTEFKRKLSDAQWAALHEDPEIRDPADALRVVLVFGFENRRLERLHLRSRGRDRVFAEPQHRERMAKLLGRPPPKPVARRKFGR